MLIFDLYQNSVKVSGKATQMAQLRSYLTVKIANAYFASKKKWNPRTKKLEVVKWNSSIRFFGQISKRFSYGLWGHVKFFLKDNEIKYQVINHRSKLPRLDSRKLGGVKLYKKQVQSCNAWFKAGGYGIVWAAPGFGKTEVSCAIINQMLKRQYANRVLFVVNGLDLLEQAVNRIKLRTGLNVGSISGSSVSLNKIITVTAIQKIHRMLKSKDPAVISFLSKIDLLVYDETHHSRSTQTAMLIKHCPAKYRLGVSARPLRIDYKTYETKDLSLMKADDVRVIAAIGPIVKRVPASQLIGINKLAKPSIYFYPLNFDDYRDATFHAENMKWPDAKKKFVIENSVIHKVASKQALEAAKVGQTTLVIAGGSLKLGLNVYHRMKDENLNVVYLHGGIDKKFRAKSRQRMIDSKLDACIATTIYDEGIDIPNLRQLILAYGGLSPMKNEQRLGRGLRNKIGANEVVVVDFMHYSNKYLRKHSYERLKMYLEEGAYKVYLVGKHTPYVVRLVGKENVVESLPDKKVFKELKNARPAKRDRP